MKKMLSFFVCAVFALLPYGDFAAEEGDRAAAYVDGVPIYLSQVESEMSTNNVMYSYLEESLTDAQIAQKKYQARLDILNALVEKQVYLNKLAQHGITLTASVSQSAQEKYDALIASIEEYVLASYPDLSGDALNEQVDAMLAVSGKSREQYRAAAQEAALLEALYQSVRAQCQSVSEEAISAYYDELYQRQKTAFDEDITQYEAALLSGEIIAYRPAEVKCIKKAEFKFDAEIIALLRQLETAGDPETAQEMIDDQYALLTEEVEPIYQKLLSGETSFDEVLEDLNPGSSASVNYYCEGSTRFDETYALYANSFETAGEISPAYPIEYGCALLYYASSIPACEQVPLDEIRAQIEAVLLNDAQAEHLSSTLGAWRAEAEIVLCTEVLQ